MPPLRLIIPGEWWDSQIYAGRLYLFSQLGEVVTLFWDKLIDEWPLPAGLRLPMQCAFKRSDLLYNRSVAVVLDDPEMREVLKGKFERLSHQALEVQPEDLGSFVL